MASFSKLASQENDNLHFLLSNFDNAEAWKADLANDDLSDMRLKK